MCHSTGVIRKRNVANCRRPNDWGDTGAPDKRQEGTREARVDPGEWAIDQEQEARLGDNDRGALSVNFDTRARFVATGPCVPIESMASTQRALRQQMTRFGTVPRNTPVPCHAVTLSRRTREHTHTLDGHDSSQLDYRLKPPLGRSRAVAPSQAAGLCFHGLNRWHHYTISSR